MPLEAAGDARILDVMAYQHLNLDRFDPRKKGMAGHAVVVSVIVFIRFGGLRIVIFLS